MWLIGAIVYLLAAPWVQLSVSAGNEWPHNALRHYWLMPISCHFRDCKALLVTSLTHISGAVTIIQTLTFTFKRQSCFRSFCTHRQPGGGLQQLQIGSALKRLYVEDIRFSQLPDKTNRQYNLKQRRHNLSLSSKTDARNFVVKKLFNCYIFLPRILHSCVPSTVLHSQRMNKCGKNVQIHGANVSVRWQCVTWDSLEFVAIDRQTDVSSTVERMFVRTYKNGCRPRYECIQFRLAAPGVLLYRHSRYRLWPFNGTTGVMVDCRSLFTYDDVWYQLLVSASGLHARCRLPANAVDEELNVELKSGLRCRGTILLVIPSEGAAEEGTASTGFKLLLRDCPAGHDSEQVYRCLDSSRQFDGDQEEVGRAVLVSADGAGGDLLCWWFGRSDVTRFLLLSASACYDGRMAATIQPLAVFTRSSSAFTSAVVTTATSLSTPSHKLEAEQVTDVTNDTDNIAIYWNRFMALIAVTYLSTIYMY